MKNIFLSFALASRRFPMLICFLLAFCLAPSAAEAQVIDTAAVRREVDSLVQVCRGLTGKRQFEEALRVIEVAEGKAELGFGKMSAGYATCLHNHARVYQIWGKLEEAEPVYLKVIKIRAEVLGKEHLDYAWSLNNLANLYYKKGDYARAEPLYLEAKEIRAKALGKENLDYAWSLNNLALLYYQKGDYEKAEPLHRETIAIRKKVLGKEHPDYAMSLNNLAVIYKVKGDYEKAEPLYIEAKSIQEKVLGKEHPDYAQSLHNLANLYRAKGDYDKAKALHLQAKSIREKVLGKEHPDYAQSLTSLANIYWEQGDYYKAEQLRLEAKTILAKMLGKERPDYATSLNNLAVLYKTKGDFEKAEPLYIEAKSIRGKVLGKEHPDYATSLNNLANLYYAKGDYEKAEPMHLEAKSIREKVLGKENPDYAQSLNNLANLYRAKGDYDKAEPLYKEAKAILEKALGKEHPEYAVSLHNLAILYFQKGEYIKAEPLFSEAKAIWEKALGKEHPEYAASLNNLAVLYQATNRIPESTALFLESNELARRLIEKSAAYSSEHEQLQYAALFKDRSATFLSFLQSHPTDSLLIAAYDNALFQNNALLDAAAARERAISQADSATQATHAEWKSFHFRLNKQYALPIAERDSALVAMIEAQANQYEKELVRRSPAFVEARKVITWQQVRDRLLPGQAAIEFISYRYNTPQRVTDSIQYAALILLPGQKAPIFVPLCEQKQLEAIIDTAPQSNHAEVWDNYIQRVYAASQLGKPSLYNLIWKPLESYLPKTKTIFFSPDGLLHRLNLGAFRDPQGAYMGQRYQMVQLGSTRRLVQPATYHPADNSISLFGGIRYDLDSTKIAAAVPTESVNGTRGGSYLTNSDSILRGGLWDYLPGTNTEVEGIAARCQKHRFQVTKFTGNAANEESVKNIGVEGRPSPRVLHLATHGFFSPDPKTELRRDALLDGERIVRLSDDPMRRAGLVLAGANYAWRKGKAFRPEMEDGILTAAEIKAMNLSNTELVVLSACDTGLGDVAGNEGVYGLQRAFKIAGAKYLIMSLWSVPDGPTRQLMDSFYANWLDKKMDLPAAFSAAQLTVKKEYPSPYYWGAFVLLQ